MAFKSSIDSYRKLSSSTLKTSSKTSSHNNIFNKNKTNEVEEYEDDWKIRKAAKYICHHLEDLKIKGDAKRSYKKIHSNWISSVTKSGRLAKARMVRCAVCEKKDGFLLGCLHCVFIGCLKLGHMKKHFKDTGHSVVCDLQRGTLYCFKCVDVLFDQEFEAIGRHNEKKLEFALKIPWNTNMLNKRHIDRISESGTRMSIATSPKSTFGLRGFINLGHTCFMNCIVQSFMHTPLLRDFFLAERINCHERHDLKKQKPCIVTHLCDLYHEFYKGTKSPMSLHALLHKIWGNAAHLAGYEQQDAHEFFIAMLDALHLHFNSPNKTSCNCVIDVLFLGRLESVLTCMQCKNRSIKVDPIWDVSLDLTIDPLDHNASITLHDCLNRYTRVEHLGPSADIFCNYCEGKQEFSKQLKFKVLPVVLCLHFKRFEHSTNYKKIDKSVRFPEHLDLTSFTSGYEDRKKVKSSKKLLQATSDSEYRYSLYAVVNHVGSLEGGHYYAYIRNTRDDWYKCDDHLITSVTRDEVLKSPGYLLFYHRSSLYYRESKSFLRSNYLSINSK